MAEDTWQTQAREHLARLLQEGDFAALSWLRRSLTGVYQAAEQAGHTELTAVAMACLGALHKWEKQQQKAKTGGGSKRVRCRLRGASGHESAVVLDLSPDLLRTAEDIPDA